MVKKFKTVAKTSLYPRGKPTRFVSALLLVTMLFALAVSSGSFVYVFANPSPTSTYYAEEGIYPGAPSYTIWRESSTYYAKDANGHIAYQSSNASQVINYALDGLPSVGGTVYLKAGYYYLDSNILITKNGTTLTGDKWAYLWQSNNANLECMVVVSTSIYDVRITNLWIEANGNNNVGSIAIRINASCWYITVDHCRILHWDKYGIEILGSTGVINIHDNYITSTQYEADSSGIRTTGMADSTIHDNQIAGGNHSCLRIGSGAYLTIVSNKFFASDLYYLYFDSVRDTIIDSNLIGGGSPYPTLDAIYMITYSSSYGYGNIISDNDFYGGQGRHAIVLKGLIGNNTISGNNIFL